MTADPTGAGIDVEGLARDVLEQLECRHETLAVAESCTGGLVGATVTQVPGASEVFLGGIISYSNAVKEEIVGVSGDLLERHGAVSEQVARAMAAGVRERLRATWGVAITGIAGPGGGTEDKPVGLVHWAVAGPEGVAAEHRVFSGDRSTVRQRSAQSALDLLRRRLLEEKGR
jgi:nicotinamide-nucleotide amidase